VKRKNRPSHPSPPSGGTAERLEAIVEAAERAAVTVIDNAEEEARRRLEEAEVEAARLVSDRLASLASLIDSLIVQAESTRNQSEDLIASLEEAKRRLEAGEAPGEVGRRRPQEQPGPSHLTAVDPVEEAPAVRGTELRSVAEEAGTPAGARLLATQMAVSGSSREEIEAKLRNGFEIEDTASILDAILGPEDQSI
jgi:vacuolar-type H+-ATPase subunit H